MFGFDDAQQSAQEVYGAQGGYDHPDHRGKFSHELLAGAASFEGMKLYEDHMRSKGETVNHQFAKELLAGFVGGEIDKLAETHGMNEIDKMRAHHQAKERAEQLYDQHYQGQDQYNPYQQGPPPQLQNRNW